MSRSRTAVYSTYTSRTSIKAGQRLAAAVADAYIDQNLDKAVRATSDSVAWLGSQVDEVKKELLENENALHDFKRRNDLPSTSINESSNMIRLEMQELNSALTRTRTRKQELLARYAELSKVTLDNPDALPASELLSSTFLQDSRAQYADAVRARKALLAEGKGENHPSKVDRPEDYRKQSGSLRRYETSKARWSAISRSSNARRPGMPRYTRRPTSALLTST